MRKRNIEVNKRVKARIRQKQITCSKRLPSSRKLKSPNIANGTGVSEPSSGRLMY